MPNLLARKQINFALGDKLFTKNLDNDKSKVIILKGKIMAKGEYEKSIRISAKPPKKQGPQVSFVEGSKQSKVAKPKSLTPLKNASSKKK